MRKCISCIVLSICMLLLPGCQQNRENRANMELFRNGYKQLQELSSVHVRLEIYSGNSWADMELTGVTNEWRNGEDFYSTSDNGSRELYYLGNCWTMSRLRPQWERNKRPSAMSTRWRNFEAVSFFAGATFKREGEYIVLEQRKDLGSDNCTFSRQISTNVFYMKENGEIVQATEMTVTYNGTDVNSEKIHSVSKRDYYIIPMDAKEVNFQIQRQYQTLG